MSDFQITYAAHTAICTFLLDGEGICRRIVVLEESQRSSKSRDAKLAARCVGAQYVASLDASISGMLAEMPRVGAPMLFARVDDRGRVSLLRTGTVTRFESHKADEDPFASTTSPQISMSASVETSAPELPPPAPRVVPEGERPIKAIRPGEFLRMHAMSYHTDSVEIPAVADVEIPVDVEEDDELARTREYRAGASRPSTIPPPPASTVTCSDRRGWGVETGPTPKTLRQPNPILIDQERDDVYAQAHPITPIHLSPPAPPVRTPRASTVNVNPRAMRPTGTESYPSSSDKIAHRSRPDR